MDNIIYSTITELAAAISNKQVSAVEVTEAHLARIARHNAAVNAVVVVYEDSARRRAKDADAALARGEVWGPLHGVPVTLKAHHSVGGLNSPWLCLPEFADRVAAVDSSVPAKLRAAGAVILGLTNAHAASDNIFGETINPWGHGRSPSGSSAGSAAAVAAGMSPLDIGSDGLASILRPAAFCGTFGMRPTEHRVSNAGLKALGVQRIFDPMTVCGPLARSVDDLALALRVISGPDGHDMSVPPIPWRHAEQASLSAVRIAWSHAFPKMPLAKDIFDAIEDLVAALARSGARIRQAIPQLDFVQAHHFAWQFIRQTADEIMRRVGMTPKDAPPLRLEDFLRSMHEREGYARAWSQFLDEWDVFLCPVWMHTASLLTDELPVVDGRKYEWDDVSPSCESISPLTGLPSVVIPVALDSQGLPIGVQLIGRRWGDERLLAIAEAVSRVAGGFRRPPGF